jgi:pimeloyl-ACP methyl ester carboxylesterase
MRLMPQFRQFNLITQICLMTAFVASVATTASPSFSQEPEATLSTVSRNPRPAVILIPGFMGSRLSRPGNGQVIWGQGTPNSKDLALGPGNVDEKVTVELLRIFEHQVIPNQDIYGSAIGALDAVTRGNHDLFIFPYDWRRDIRETADILDKRLLGLRYDQDLKNPEPWNLAGRDLYIVAHSMGGLIAWWWLHHYHGFADQPARYQFRSIRHVVLLGTPLDGTCDIIRMLMEGYQEIPDRSYSPDPLKRIAYRKLYEIFFDDLKAAALTFPSIFQLMPAPGSDENRACLLQALPQGGTKVLDYFDISSWENHCPAGTPNCDTLYNTALKNHPARGNDDHMVWEHTGMDKSTFMERLKISVDAGKEFRTEMSQSLEITKQFSYPFDITLFGSKKFETTTKLVVKWIDSAWCVPFTSLCLSPGHFEATMIRPVAGNGDGRVLESSARQDLQNVQKQLTTSEHGSLLEDDNFLNFITTELLR